LTRNRSAPWQVRLAGNAAQYHPRVPAPVSPPSVELRGQFGEIDIYLFDQLLRGRFDNRRRVLDAGCGTGRNLPYFLRGGFDVHAVDADADAIRTARQLVASLNPALPQDHIHCGPLESLPWESDTMDAVICSAVLHFARDEQHFTTMIEEMWRVLVVGGLFFARLATSIGLEPHLPFATGRMLLPDGSERFLVDERTLLGLTSKLGGTIADPVKTTNVQNLRCMTTWVIVK
jgi:tellurite methyltransferase